MQLIKTEYVSYDKSKEYEGDLIRLIVKDKDGNKKVLDYAKPNFSYFITKDSFPVDKLYMYKYLEREKVREVCCRFKNLPYSIRNELKDPNIDSIVERMKGNSFDRRTYQNILNMDYRLHGTDVNIEDYYIYNYLEENPYEDNNFGITKAFFDIEVDSSKIRGFPDQSVALCPVNAISYVNLNDNTIYEFLLSYSGEESYENFISRLDEFKEMIIKKYKDMLDIDFDVNITLYDYEEELITSFFNRVNEDKPDFCAAWNMDFDFAYLLNRIERLNLKPEKVMCPPEFTAKSYYHKPSKEQDPAEKHSMYCVSSYTNYIDEMSLYANITKPYGKEESYSLDYIGQKVTGMSKEEVVSNMKTFHLVDYWKFVEYSIQDSVMLSRIENKTSHIDLLYTISMITRTQIDNALKKTVSLKNLARKYALSNGFVQSNNRSSLYNANNKEKIAGAYVASPSNIDYVGMEIFGKLSKYIFEIVTDLDLASLYPSIIRALNQTVETLIGKIEFEDNSIFNGQEFMQDYISGDIINVGSKYFNLPTISDIVKIIEEEKG